MINETFCYGMMVTQLVLCGLFVIGVLYVIGHELVNLIKKHS